MYTSSEARGIMGWHSAELGHDHEPSSGMPQRSPRPEGCDHRFWNEEQRHHPRTDTARSIAFLRAYVEIAGSRFRADGIPCTDGRYIWPDKAIMREMLHGEYVHFDQCCFELTDRGRRLLWDRADAAI